MMHATLLGLFSVAICQGHNNCEIFPKNQSIKMGSDLTVTFRAPLNSDCRNRIKNFSPKRVYWKLNNELMEDGLEFNSTTASVSIKNFSLETGTIESLVDGIVLAGTIVRTYSLPKGPNVAKPIDVSCVTSLPCYKGETMAPLEAIVTCRWDHAGISPDTSYTVHLKQHDMDLVCKSRHASCQFDESVTFEGMNITVQAEDFKGITVSDEVFYSDVWSTIKIWPPENVSVKPQINNTLWIVWDNECNPDLAANCEIRSVRRGSNDHNFTTTSLSSSNEMSSVEVGGVKPCTNYSVSVRCATSVEAPWSEWSQEATVLTPLNVSTVQLQLWWTKGVPLANGKRSIHLMWKGIPPSCKAFDEYRIFIHKHNLNSSLDLKSTFLSLMPTQSHTTATLDQDVHSIQVALYRDGVHLGEMSVEVPAGGETLDFPPVSHIETFTSHGQIHVSWATSTHPVNGYVVMWNTTQENHRWQKIQEPHFLLTVPTDHHQLYSISVTPLYNDGPGNEARCLVFSSEGNSTAVSKVQVYDVDNMSARIQWQPVCPSKCCGLVNYTVFYRADPGPELNVTAHGQQKEVILKRLKPNMSYVVYVTALSVAGLSKSPTISFRTKQHGKTPVILTVVCGVVLMSLPALVLLCHVLWKKSGRKVPDPHLSSLTAWSSQHGKMIQRLTYPVKSEIILPCKTDTGDHSISNTGETDPRPLGNSTEDMSYSFSQTTNCSSLGTQDSSLNSFHSGWKLPANDLDPPETKKLTLDPQVSALGVLTPYLNQTPVSSPVETPKKPLGGKVELFSLEETKALLKSEFNSSNPISITYVTVDMFGHRNEQK